MRTIVQGLAINYEYVGNGKQVLILHGWGDDGRSWRAFARELGRRYELVVPDLPGFGGSEAPQAVWGLSEYARFVAAFIMKLKLDPYAVIAHSNGGAIALRAISAGDVRPGKLVLLAGAGIRTEDMGKKLAWRLAAKAGKVMTKPLPPSAQDKLRRKLYHAAGSDMLVAEHLQETFKRVVAEDVRSDARHITIPTLLVYGANDASTPPRYGRLLHDCIANSRLEIVPAAGHFIQVDASDAVLCLAEDFLR